MNFSIITYGCQMNQNDSKRIKRLFESSGHKETSQKEADLIIINSCSVRGRVIDRIRGKVNNIPKDKTVILTGCILDEEKEELSGLVNHLFSIENLPEWHRRLSFLIDPQKEDYFQIEASRNGPVAYLPIMTGCNNFCSYCAVPYVRGRERSRKEEDIMKEFESLVKEGFKEIWLLGQNVNSYEYGFADLLKKVSAVEGDFWVRFTSSHPKDFTNKIIKAMQSSEKITDYLNLPIQSGDDQVLRAMNRPYSVKEYKRIISAVRREIPEITLSTDIIVGFPGETEENFENTKSILREIKYDMAYIARYSPRPQTEAFKLEDDVSHKEKKRRATELTDLLKKISYEKNKRLIGETVQFLPLQKSGGFVIGKTKKYKTIKVKSKEMTGFQKAEVVAVDSFGLKGILKK